MLVLTIALRHFVRNVKAKNILPPRTMSLTESLTRRVLVYSLVMRVSIKLTIVTLRHVATSFIAYFANWGSIYDAEINANLSAIECSSQMNELFPITLKTVSY